MGKLNVLRWLVPCALCAVILVPSVASSGQRRSEAEKQSAFEQLIAAGNRLRWLARSGAPERETAVGQPTSASADLLAKDEPTKRHDRRHASGGPGEKKKREHAKRQHHAGSVAFRATGRSLAPVVGLRRARPNCCACRRRRDRLGPLAPAAGAANYKGQHPSLGAPISRGE